MKARYEEESGDSVDSAGDAAIRLRVLAGEIYNAQCQLDWLRRQMFASTADGEYLDKLAEQRGITRRAASKARGTLTFSVNNTLSYAVFIPAGTTVSSDGSFPVRIVTTEDTELPENTYSVTVNAEAEQAGFIGNVSAGDAVVPVSVPSGIDAVRNSSAFTGGDDAETDDALRERVIASFYSRPNGMNASYYRQLAESVDGVDKAGIIERLNGDYTLGIYLCGRGGAVSDSVLNAARQVIEENRGVNVVVTVGRASPVLFDLTAEVTAKAGYSAEEVTNIITAAFTAFIGSLPAGGRLYLSNLGKCLMETGCIDNYEFDDSMQSRTISGAQYFENGEIEIEVV